MGLGSSKEKKKFEIINDDDLQFYMDVEDPLLGFVKIYTSHRFHLCFILKYESTHNDTKIYNIFKKVEESQLNPLLSLHGFNIQRKSCLNQICEEKITSYWEYYNFYFNDYIGRRSRQGLPFLDLEIWHIVEVCCETYNLFRKFGIFYEVSPETFVITPEGKLKALWCHLRSQNCHMKYFEYFDLNYKIARFAYAPEQLQCFHKKERTVKIDFDKCNSFRLGILLLYCLTLIDPLAHCYSPSMTSISSSCIRGLINNKVTPNYSNEIVNLVKNLLRMDTAKRPTLEQIYEQHFSRFSPYFELKVCGIKTFDSPNQHNESEEQPQFPLQKKASDFSEAKTVKYSHSNRNN